METCRIEAGLFRKKPCGHVAVAKCVNCEQPLCAQHAVAQLTDAGNKTGKFMCQECAAAQKDHAKSMAAVARAQEEKKRAAIEKGLLEKASAAAPAKTPAARPAPAPAQPAPAEQPQGPDALEFTPKDGKLEYTRKKGGPGAGRR